MFKLVQEEEAAEFLGFKVGAQEFCIDVQHLEEIIYIPHLSKIPNVPSHIEGAINLRGHILHVVNMRKWFKLQWIPFTEKSRILVVDLDKAKFGLLVDEVTEIIKKDVVKSWENPGLFQEEKEVAYLKSVISKEKQLILEIDPKIIQNEVV